MVRDVNLNWMKHNIKMEVYEARENIKYTHKT